MAEEICRNSDHTSGEREREREREREWRICREASGVLCEDSKWENKRKLKKVYFYIWDDAIARKIVAFVRL